MPAALLLAFAPQGLDARHAAAFDRVAGAFPRRVRRMQFHDEPLHAASDQRPPILMRTWTHAAAVGGAPARDAATESWLTVLGNPTRADLAGLAPEAVAPALLREALTSIDVVDTLSPPFAVVFCDRRAGSLWVSIDQCGLQHLYVREDPDGAVWVSSSLLALAQVLGATIDAEAVAEWLAAGSFVSQRTLVREIRKMQPGELLRLNAAGVRSECRRVATAVPPREAEPAYRQGLLSALAACHADPLTAAELTGGLDSRLLLAGRLKQGLPTLSWTIGDPSSPDLRTIERLRRVCEIEHIGVALRAADAARVPELMLEMHELCEGEVNALEYCPLLHAFDELDGLRRISISGTGGEASRGYFHRTLRPKTGGGFAINVDALVRKISTGGRPAAATLSRELFPAPLEPLHAAVERALASAPAGSAKVALAEFYVRARMQRFGGRNITTTGLFARQGLPFLDNDVVAASFALPPDRQRDGRAMREALMAWAPPLARVPLETGIRVQPRSWRAPDTHLRWGLHMGRRALVRYGGRRVQRLAPRPTIPWAQIAAAPALHELIRDLLPPTGARVHELLDPAGVCELRDRALAGGRLYPLGLVLTLELSLRRIAARA